MAPNHTPSPHLSHRRSHLLHLRHLLRLCFTTNRLTSITTTAIKIKKTPSQPPPSRSRKPTPSPLPPSPSLAPTIYSPSPSPDSPLSPHLSPSPSPPSSAATAKQLSNILDALIGSGDFGSWVNIITAASPLSLPLSATIFMPQNDAVVARVVSTADPLVFPYHVVAQRLTFADLRLFKTQSRLPTLLPGKSILITNNSQSNFTVDDAPVTHPDVYVTAAVAVHGVATFLDYTTYGDALSFLPNQQQSQSQSLPLQMSPSPKKRPELLPPAGVYIPGLKKSGATRPPCLGGRFPIGLIALAFLVLGNRRRNYFEWL